MVERDSDLWRKKKDFIEFDIPFAVLLNDDPIRVLVTVHLHLEAFVTALIVRCLVKPTALDIDRLSFPNKLGLAVALDVILEVAAPALRTINSIRNRLVHNLRADITVDDSAALRQQLGAMITSVREVDAAWPAARQVAACALLLQAWLNGFVKMMEVGDPPISDEELWRLATERYSHLRPSCSDSVSNDQ